MYFEKLEEKPDDFINITDKELQKYPFISVGIKLKEVSLKCEEFEEFLDLMDEQDTRNIFLNNSYYHIKYVTP